MTAQTAIYLGVAAWLLSGLWFWIFGNIKTGWPDCWHSTHNRYTGWDEALFVILPICLICGPFLWGAKVYLRYGG